MNFGSLHGYYCCVRGSYCCSLYSLGCCLHLCYCKVAEVCCKLIVSKEHLGLANCYSLEGAGEDNMDYTLGDEEGLLRDSS